MRSFEYYHQAVNMGKNKRCCMGNCDNDQRYPLRVVVKPHVKEVKMASFSFNYKENC